MRAAPEDFSLFDLKPEQACEPKRKRKTRQNKRGAGNDFTDAQPLRAYKRRSMIFDPLH
jgi:hypothetical protein